MMGYGGGLLECPVDCPGLDGYRMGQWHCREVGHSLTDNYDLGACCGPNRPYVDTACPRLLKCGECGCTTGLGPYTAKARP